MAGEGEELVEQRARRKKKASFSRADLNSREGEGLPLPISQK